MDDKKFAIIIHKTDENTCDRLVKSLKNLSTPKKFDVEILPVEGEGKFSAYQKAMKQSNAKYKIYLDENVVVLEKNLLSNLLKIFKSDEKIGMIGVSGALELSTHGICWGSTKRCGKVFVNENRQRVDWINTEELFQEVEVIDGFFIATQYDLNWRCDLFRKNQFGDAAQCIEFRRQGGGYRVVVANQETPFIWYSANTFQFDEESRQIFLNEYSKDIFPLVSVLIPTFNRPQYFQQAIQSVLNQTYKNIEIIISDDSTNDETEKLIQSYLSDSRIKYFRHKGFTAAENWGFLRSYNNSAAEYVNWLMDDDLFHPKKIELMVEVYRNNPDVSIVTSRRDFIDENSKFISKSPEIFGSTLKVDGEEAAKLLFLIDNYIGEPTTVLIRKKFLRNNDLFWLDEENEKGSPLVDVSTWIHLLTQGNLFWINESLSAFRNHLGQDTFAEGNGAKIIMYWAKYLKEVLDRKIFLKTEFEIRSAFIHWLNILALKLRESQMMNYNGEEVSLLEEFYIAMAKAFRNGYKIDLPPIKYSGVDDFKTLERNEVTPLQNSITPLVSVIIPTFNRPQYFQQALESALNQTYKNIEIIVSDNSTNDETETLIQSYLADSRIKYFHHKDFTANDNWNFARKYNNPDAEYVNWLMDDDLFYPSKIELMIKTYQQMPDVSIVTSTRDYIDEGGKIIYKSSQIYTSNLLMTGDISGKMLFTMYQNILIKFDDFGNAISNEFTPDNFIGGLTNVLIKKKFLRDNDLCYFDDEKGFYPLADVSTWLRLLRKGNMAFLNESLSAVRMHPARATYKNEMSAIVAICWAKLIKYFWDKKLFLTEKADMRNAFFNWIKIAATMFTELQRQDYHGQEVTALEDLNIAMAEALHNEGKINLPPSAHLALKKFL